VTASPEPGSARAPSEARRAGRELVLDLVFRPLSDLLVPALRRLGVAPPAVVLANAAAGLVAAGALATGALVLAAVLLQLKSLLDNTDGQLARATGRVTLAGRYLDTIADLVVNAALFAALGHVTGKPLLALAGFVALTLVLAADFNATVLYREAHGAPTPQSPPTGSRTERALTLAYGVVFGPLDRLYRRLFGHAGVDRLAVAALANLGLSTQLLALGVCLVLDAPEAYLWLVLGSLLVVAALVARGQPLRRRRAA
jgi:archaetidylinositol phosphate synthase